MKNRNLKQDILLAVCYYDKTAKGKRNNMRHNELISPGEYGFTTHLDWFLALNGAS